MTSIELEIRNPSGLHARPAALDAAALSEVVLATPRFGPSRS